MRPPNALARFACAFVLLVASCAASAQPATSDDEAIAHLQAAFDRAVTPGATAALHGELLGSVMRRVKRSHIRDVDLQAFATTAIGVLDAVPPGTGDPAEMFRLAVNRALRTLDPYSRYMDARTHANQRTESSGSYAGIGIEVDTRRKDVRIGAVVPEGPAARAGLLAGDRIVKVDDLAVDADSLTDALSRMRGDPGTLINLTVRRGEAADDFSVAITRAMIHRQVVKWSFDGDTLVVKLSVFSGPVAANIARAIAEARAQREPAALVLDLRGNPGGLFREAIRVADAFLQQGEIVSEHGNAPDRVRAWQADRDELLAGVPMVVLLDERSASASELVADALQFHHRATVMGRNSYGKGSVQTTFSLGEGKGAVKLTTSLYHGPSGRTLNGIGVVPDIELVPGQPPDRPSTAAPAQPVKLRVDEARCAREKAADATLSCVLAYLHDGATGVFAALPAD